MRLSHLWHRSAVSTAAAALAAFGFTTAAQADSIKTVFVIAISAHGGWSPPPSRCSSAPRGGCWDVYAPLQQLQTGLANNTVANYNWITPNQYNDMHSTLSGGYKGLTGDAASIKQGDDFLSQIVPMIMASQAYQNDGAIMVWWDETEGTNANDFSHTSPSSLSLPWPRATTTATPSTTRTPPPSARCRKSSASTDRSSATPPTPRTSPICFGRERSRSPSHLPSTLPAPAWARSSGRAAGGPEPYRAGGTDKAGVQRGYLGSLSTRNSIPPWRYRG